MKIVIAGGSGFLGKLLTTSLTSAGHDIVVLTRGRPFVHKNARYVQWDGATLGPWSEELASADVLINLAGKSVNCRYTRKNRREILTSRTNSVKVLDEALRQNGLTVPVWIQSSSATIYRHADDRPMTEIHGEIGNGFSVDVCREWERTFEQVNTATRKVVLRTGIVIGKSDGAWKRMVNLSKNGLGGRMGSGQQRISWLHEDDWVGIIKWVIHTNANGIYNCTSPDPVPNAVFMKELCDSLSVPLRIPTPNWLLSAGAILIGTETELILKSRWVLPERLLKEGYRFSYATISNAVKALLDDKPARH